MNPEITKNDILDNKIVNSSLGLSQNLTSGKKFLKSFLYLETLLLIDRDATGNRSSHSLNPNFVGYSDIVHPAREIISPLPL